LGLSTDDVRAIVRGVDPKVYSWVNFAGGEPSRTPELLAAGVQAAHETGLRAGMVSAPIWAKNLIAAEEFLTASGLDVLTLSYDIYHLEFLRDEHYEHAIQAAQAKGISVNLNVCFGKPEELEALGRQVQKFRIKSVNFSQVLPIGNAKQMHENMKSGGVTIRSAADLLRLRRSCDLGNPLVSKGEMSACCTASSVAGSPLAHFAYASPADVAAGLAALEAQPTFQKILSSGLIDGLGEHEARAVARCVDGMTFVNECDLCAHLMGDAQRGLWDAQIAGNGNEPK
jgi:hypothetical protein